MATTATVTVGVAILPVVTVESFRISARFVTEVTQHFNQRALLDAYPGIKLSAAMSLLAIVLYALAGHRRWIHDIKPKTDPQLRDSFTNIDRSGPAFITYAACLLYIAVGILLLGVYSYVPALSAPLQLVFVTWLAAPVVVLSVLSTAILSIGAALVLTAGSGLRRYAPTLGFLRQLLIALDGLADVRSTRQLSPERRGRVIARIQRAADTLPTILGKHRSSDPVASWAISELEAASKQLRSLASSLAIASPETVPFVKDQLVLYINAVGTGELNALPRGSADASAALLYLPAKQKAVSQLVTFVVFFAFIAGPPIAWTALAGHLSRSSNDAMGPALLMAYSAWLAGGVFVFVDRLAPERRSVLLDIVRVITGR